MRASRHRPPEISPEPEDGRAARPYSASAPHAPRAIGALVPIGLLTLIWGFNWPVMKMGVAQFDPLTYRSLTMPFAALSLMAVARLSGDTLSIPRRLWAKVAVLTLFNISLWNGLLLFGVQNLPAGRSAILAYTMPIWSVLISMFLVHEPLSPRKLAGLAIGMAGMGMLLGDDIGHLERTPIAALIIVAAAASWAFGTVLLRKWNLPVSQNALSGWMLLLGFVPIGILAPWFATMPLRMPDGEGMFAVFYSIFLAGTVAHWAWYRVARTLPIIVSSMTSLPVPVVGVFSGMLLLGERPGVAEWTALGLVVVAMIAVLWPPRAAPAARL